MMEESEKTSKFKARQRAEAMKRVAIEKKRTKRFTKREALEKLRKETQAAAVAENCSIEAEKGHENGKDYPAEGSADAITP
jgi:hypothetical protein